VYARGVKMGTYYSNQLLAFTNMKDTARDEKALSVKCTFSDSVAEVA
jgi:hypothetical protein